MENWQNENHKRFLSTDIQQDGDMFCCIALTNPTEVVITDMRKEYQYARDNSYVQVKNGKLCVTEDQY
ncbi:MAG TPA: hypothetical protein V6C71_00645 [Coleofasciculaceae cyanobacterium]